MPIKLTVLSTFLFAVGSIHTPAVLAYSATQEEDCILNAVEKVDMPSEQKIKIKLFVHKAKMQITLKRHELHTINLHTYEAFHSGDMNIAKINTFAKQEERVMGAIARIRLFERYKIFQILTAEQRETINTSVEQCLGSADNQQT